MVRLVEHVPQRRFEPVCHLARIGHEREVGRDHPEHGGERVARAGDEAVRLADHADLGRVDREFLVRLAQGGGHRVLACLQLAAGKGDLARMAWHRVGPVGQQHARLGPVGYRDQHGSRPQRLGREGAVVAQTDRAEMTARVEQFGQPVEQGAHAGTREKRAPWL